MNNEQAVTTETDVEDTPSTEEGGAQDIDLDQVLSEFDQETQETEKGSEQPTESLGDEDKAFLNDLKARETDRQITEEVDRMSEYLPDDINLPKTALRAMLEFQASKNPKIAEAFVRRESNPEAWAKVSKKLTSDIAKEFQSQPDKKSTDDREAVIAAVKSVSTTSQEADLPKFSEMNDAQFNAWERKQRG